MSKRMRAIGIILSAAMLISSLAGCANSKETNGENTASAITYNGDAVYPVQCDDTLTLWMELSTSISTTTSDFGDTDVAKELEKETGVKIEYLHPASGMVGEQFNLLLTSNDLPDIIRYNWHNYGVRKAVNENFILRLNDVIDKWAPNYKAYLNEHPEVAKQIKTDEGDICVFPFIRGDESLCLFSGPIIRKDWLDKLGLPVPETIDEWEVMLRRFKDELGATVPLSMGSMQYFAHGFLTGAYKVVDDYFVADDGTVKYGPAEPGYKEFLTRMNKWYEEGLLDKNFPSTDMKIFNGYFLNGNTGATCGYAASAMGTLLSSAKDIEGFDLVGAPYPVLNKGDRPFSSQWDWQYTNTAAWAISTQCKNPELAARFLDYGYGEKGQITYNYGVEGKSYEMVDGKPAFTDLITDNEEAERMVSLYCMTSGSAPSIQWTEIVESRRPYQQQNDAVKVWQETDVAKHKLPHITLSDEEREKISGVATEISTYKYESEYAFIMGERSLEEFDKYVDQLNELGLPQVLECYTAAVKRYQTR
ncbi:MAG: extracellular solute-binding protein [Clostridia bacterium]|nr:extracellular solute-binding protein [Clostridia bacterium]